MTSAFESSFEMVKDPGSSFLRCGVDFEILTKMWVSRMKRRWDGRSTKIRRQGKTCRRVLRTIEIAESTTDVVRNESKFEISKSITYYGS